MAADATSPERDGGPARLDAPGALVVLSTAAWHARRLWGFDWYFNPRCWRSTSDGFVPLRVFLLGVAMMRSQQAVERLEAAEAHRLARLQDPTVPLAQTRAAVFGPPA